jgi:hypothetical protein
MSLLECSLILSLSKDTGPSLDFSTRSDER